MRRLLCAPCLSAVVGWLSRYATGDRSRSTLTDTVARGVGFTAIIVAWLANLSSPVILMVSMIFAVLEKGGGYIHRCSRSRPARRCPAGDYPLLVLGFEFFIRYRIVLRNRGSKQWISITFPVLFLRCCGRNYAFVCDYGRNYHPKR